MHATRLSRTLAFIAAIAAPLMAFSAELPAAAPGPYAVGSTNIQVTLPAADALPMIEYLNGKLASPKAVYMDDILAHKDAALLKTVTVPAGHPGAGQLAGQSLPLLLYVLYPTAKENARPSYTFPYTETGDNVFPHMQRPGEAPIFADAAAKYPVIIYSGGYNTHGLWHLAHLKTLASHGYVVVDIFHGDARGPGFLESMALRQVAFKAATDFILTDPAFAGHVDAERVGASGASAGGQTILSMMGGVRPGGMQPSVHDPRIKAGFGTVPFTGTSFGVWPMQVDAWFFGKDYAGLQSVKVPYFAIAGEKDESCPSSTVQASARRVGGPAWVVELAGASHNLGEGGSTAEAEARAWELVFFDAYLRGYAAARALLVPGNTVQGSTRSRMLVSPLN
ncbi:alpha/beta hydrolase family protein [Roseateles paludis]|uniref:Peptidase S9 prolyl oligopeptidase catalytic domain-containing protein n=1 Tax=Roseateles paludis TaxID=3145238 RepID=A0ABV0FYM8_9BURK